MRIYELVKWNFLHSVPNHYLSQCWLIIKWNPRKNFQWNLIEIQQSLCQKIGLKIRSAKWRPFCFDSSGCADTWDVQQSFIRYIVWFDFTTLCLAVDFTVLSPSAVNSQGGEGGVYKALTPPSISHWWVMYIIRYMVNTRSAPRFLDISFAILTHLTLDEMTAILADDTFKWIFMMKMM